MGAILNIQIDQGATFSNEIVVNQSDGITALDLTGYTVKSEIRKSQFSKNSIVEISADIFDPVNGKIKLNLTSSQTRDIPAGRYKFDAEIKAPGTESTVQSVTVVTGGTGYTSAPVTFTGGGASVQATGTATIGSTIITSISVDTPGSGYISDPLITITGDGTGATATALRGGVVSRVVEGIITVRPEVTRI